MEKLMRALRLIKSLKWLIIATALSLVTAFFAVQFPVAIQRITDTINARDQQGFYFAIAYAAAMLLLQGISFYGLCRAQNIFVKKNMLACRNRLYHAVMSQPFETYLRQDPGDYTSMMINDLRFLEDDFYHALLELTAKIIMFTFAFIQLIRLNPLFLIGLGIVGLIMALIPALFGGTIERKRQKQLDAMTNQSKLIKDHLQGFLTIAQFNLGEIFFKKMAKTNEEVEKSNLQFKTLIAKINTILMLTTVLLTLVTFFIGGMLVLNQVLTLGALLAATQLMIYVSEPIVSMTQACNQIKSSVPIIDKVSSFFSQKEVLHKTELSSETIDRIEVNNVSFAFEKNSGINVISDLSLVFEKGKKYLLKGDNGSGKSTLLNLISGHLKPSYGWIGYFNSKSQLIGQAPRTAIVSQNTYLFEGSIYDNVTLFALANEDVFELACRQSGLNELLNELHGGKDYVIVNNGENLSGGQRQKIAIARALYFGADIIIFDEANAALDDVSSKFIDQTVSAFEDKLCIVVSHKHSADATIYDEIIHLTKAA